MVVLAGLDGGRRARWRDLAAAQRMACVVVAFDTPAAQCRARNRARTRPVPAAALTAQLRVWPAVRDALPGEGTVITPEPVRVVPGTRCWRTRSRLFRCCGGRAASRSTGPSSTSRTPPATRARCRTTCRTCSGTSRPSPARRTSCARTARRAGGRWSCRTCPPRSSGRRRPRSTRSCTACGPAVHAGPVDDHVGRFRELAEAGVAEVVVRLPGLVDAEPITRMAEVIRAFR